MNVKSFDTFMDPDIKLLLNKGEPLSVQGDIGHFLEN